MNQRNKISVQLDTLLEPLRAYCDMNATTPSVVIRKCLAKLLHVEAPQLKRGNPAFVQKYKVVRLKIANAKRRKKK